MGTEDKKESTENIDASKIDEYFKDAPTNEDHGSDGWSEVDQKAADLLDQAFRVWTVVETDEENDIEYRKPTKKSQIEESQKLIDKASKVNSKDGWITNRIKELQEVVDSGKQKIWDGSYKLMIASVLLAIFMFVVPGLKSCSKVSEITLEQAATRRQSLIGSYTTSQKTASDRLAQLEKGEEANPNLTKPQIKDQIKSAKKSIKSYDKKLKEYNDMSDKKMLGQMKASKRKFGWRYFWKGLFYLLCIVLYYFVSFVPQFVLDKRQTEKKIMAATSGFFSAFWNGFTNLLINQPASYTTRYHYSDGSTRNETTANITPLIGLALKIGIPLLWYFMNMILLPFTIIVKYVRNYHLYI